MAKKGEYSKNANARSKYQRDYQGSPEQKKRRAQRNKARRHAEAKGEVHKGDGKEIHHRDGNPSNHSAKNEVAVNHTTNEKSGGAKGGRARRKKKN